MGEVVVGGVDVGGMMWMGCVLEIGVVWAVDGCLSCEGQWIGSSARAFDGVEGELRGDTVRRKAVYFRFFNLM